MGGHLECVLWEFRQPNTHSEPINKPLVDEIMDFPDIIYRNNNYVENLHATGNNENKNIISKQHFNKSKQYSFILFMQFILDVPLIFSAQQLDLLDPCFIM